VSILGRSRHIRSVEGPTLNSTREGFNTLFSLGSHNKGSAAHFPSRARSGLEVSQLNVSGPSIVFDSAVHYIHSDDHGFADRDASQDEWGEHADGGDGAAAAGEVWSGR
jgi:hypothetical protein